MPASPTSRFASLPPAWIGTATAAASNYTTANPKATFTGGISPAQYAINILACTFGFGVMAIALIVAGTALLGLFGTWIKILIILIMLPLLLPYFRKNHPRRFTAQAVPPDLLPLEQTS